MCREISEALGPIIRELFQQELVLTTEPSNTTSAPTTINEVSMEIGGDSVSVLKQTPRFPVSPAIPTDPPVLRQPSSSCAAAVIVQPISAPSSVPSALFKKPLEVASFNNKPAATIILQKGMYDTWKKYLYRALQASNILYVLEPTKVPCPTNDPRVLAQHCTRFQELVAQQLTPSDFNKISHIMDPVELLKALDTL